MGVGLWTDNNNVNTLYESNTVINNLNEGIKHEVSYSAIIRNNTVKDNGKTKTVWLWNSQIEVQNSSNVEVYGNTVEVQALSGNGIGIINQNRGSGTLGPWVAANNYVHNNTVTYLDQHGISGLADDTRGNKAIGNRFDSNRYITPKGDAMRYHWIWAPNKGYQWHSFKSMGQETNGDCCR
jgi:parallel beta-helix repeat protein